MPFGMVEIGATHFAPNRLGYTTWVTRIWGRDIEPFFCIVFTRVLEKSAAFTLHLTQSLLEKLREWGMMPEWTVVKMWSDCGPKDTLPPDGQKCSKYAHGIATGWSVARRACSTPKWAI